MAEHMVCPWWIGYLLASPVRRLWNDPAKLLAPYVREGMTVLEPGPGMGFFTLEMARRVGEAGRVVAVDVQPRMLESLKRRALKAGLLSRIDLRLAPAKSLAVKDLAASVDFALAFAVVHEMPSDEVFFQEVAEALKPGGLLLISEPRGHVDAAHFEGELVDAVKVGLRPVEHPRIGRTHAALLKKE